MHFSVVKVVIIIGRLGPFEKLAGGALGISSPHLASREKERCLLYESIRVDCVVVFEVEHGDLHALPQLVLVAEHPGAAV
jgi:hypothetical protein